MAEIENMKDLVGYKFGSASMQGLASGFAQVANGVLNYGALNVQSDFAEIQAASVEVQAEQEANALRERFLNATGNVISGAAKRGIKVSSANVADNMETSSGNLAKDIQRRKKVAAAQADVLKTQAKINRKSAKAQLVSGALNGLSSLAGSVSDFSVGYKLTDGYKNLFGGE